MAEFTQEELNNLLVLIETGARAIAERSDLQSAQNVLAAAAQLINKLRPEPVETPEGE